MSTVRCLKIRFSVRRLSTSSSLGPNWSIQAEIRSSRPGRHVAVDAAEPVVVGVHPLPGHRLVELHQLLALLEHPQERRHRTDVERHGGDVEQMIEDAGDLVEQHPDVLRADRHLDAQQLLHRQHEAVLLHQHRAVVETVEVGDRLQIGADLDELLGAAMQQADMRIGALDHLAVHLEQKAQHTMGRRVLRPEIDGVVAHLDFRHRAPFQSPRRSLVPRPRRGQFVAFSSPGSRPPPPSQGERKSQLRKSWRSCTGS